MGLALKAVIFATDDGAAIKSKKSVALHKIFDKYVLEYTISAIKKAGIDMICIVASEDGREIEKIAKRENTSFICNSEISKVHELLYDFLKDCEHVIMLNSDLILLNSDLLVQITGEHIKNGKPLSCISLRRQNEDFSTDSIYDTTASDNQYIQPQVICSTIYYIHNMIKNNTASLNLLNEIMKVLQKSENEALYFVAKDSDSLYKINNRMDLIIAQKTLCRRTANIHINNGVTIIQPDTTYIGSDVQIGADTIIYPGASLEGNTKIGENCVIGYNSRIVNSTISNETEVFYSTVLDSSVGSETHVGPYAFVRPNSTIGNNVKIGDFVEIKNATVGNNTKVSHLAYVGDADVGENVNFGCGAITVNYDGDKKYRTKIGDSAFIGSNSNLVSPVEIGSDAFIAAGSTITDTVPDNALAIARCRQTVKPEWQIKRKSGLKHD